MKAIEVLKIEDRYSDNNGAYEVLRVKCEDGTERSCGNAYDQSVCFRNMNVNDLLSYADKNAR